LVENQPVGQKTWLKINLGIENLGCNNPKAPSPWVAKIKRRNIKWQKII